MLLFQLFAWLEPKWLRINVRPKLARRPTQSDTSDVRLEEQIAESDKSRGGEGEPIFGGGSGIPHDPLKFQKEDGPMDASPTGGTT